MRELLIKFLEVSVTVAAIGGILTVLSPVLNKRFPLKWKRCIWLLLGLRLLIPFSVSLPQAPVTVEIPQIQPARTTPQAKDITISPVVWNSTGTTAQQPEFDITQLIFIIWLAAAAVILMRSLLGYHMFRRKALRWSLPAAEEQLEVYLYTAGKIGLNTLPSLKVTKQVNSPMLAGIIRPVILLPNSQYDKKELELILCHELIHYKRKDTWLKMIMLLAKSFHWFNPIIHLIANQTERDIELACDEKVIEVTGNTDRKIYGSLILDRASSFQRTPAVLTTDFYPGKKLLTERITNIMTKNKKSGGILLLALAATATLLCGMFIVFTSETEATENQQELAYVQEEYAQLLALKPTNYEDMTIAEFRQAVYNKIDNAGYDIHDLLDRDDEKLEEQRYTDPDSSFIVNTLRPLIADSWETRNFGTWWTEEGTITELWLMRTVLDENVLTVRQHNDAVLGALTAAEEFIRKADQDILNDADKLENELIKIGMQFSDETISIGLSVWYESDEYDSLTDSKVTDEGSEVIKPSNKQDYEDLLKLKYPGYENLTVREYRTQIEEAFGGDSEKLDESFERILMDAVDGRMNKEFDQEEHTFLTLTLYATIAEYAAEQQSQYSDQRRIPFFSEEYFGDSYEYEIVIPYDIYFDILQPDALTIRERDETISSLLNDIRLYLADREDDFWKDGEKTVEKYMEEACNKYSNDSISFRSDIYSYYYNK